MQVEIVPLAGRDEGRFDLSVNRNRTLVKLTTHDLNDIEFVLAQCKAMARRCTAAEGEHTCALAPGHDDHGLGLLRLADTAEGWRTVPAAGAPEGREHQCRACTYRWAPQGIPAVGSNQPPASQPE
jgi:hypothetical protein